jgi:diphthamide synthase (EF-2-diphthine--ammonia ligase)
MDDFRLVVAFDSDAPDFTRGVEVGMLYQRLVSENLPISAMVHATNAEMALRLAEAVDVTVRAQDCGEDWLEVNFT